MYYLQMNWQINLYVDEALSATLGGIHGVHQNASIAVGVFNHDGFIPEILDEFKPPSASTKMRLMA